MTTAAVVRPERPGDAAAIDAVVRAAFGGAREAELVARLRAADALILTLVAEDDGGAVVGHIAFSPLPVAAGAGTVDAVALAPLAVHPAHQRRGVGSLLVREGLARLRDGGAPPVVVLGDPAYYRRFGFRAEAARGLRCPFAGPALQALAFAGASASPAGDAAYHPAFFAA